MPVVAGAQEEQEALQEPEAQEVQPVPVRTESEAQAETEAQEVREVQVEMVLPE